MIKGNKMWENIYITGQNVTTYSYVHKNKQTDNGYSKIPTGKWIRDKTAHQHRETKI